MNKKIITAVLLILGIVASSMLHVLKSQIVLKSDIDANNYPVQTETIENPQFAAGIPVPALPPEGPAPIFVAGEPNPTFEGGTNFMVQQIDPTVGPAPNGCQLTQENVDDLLLQITNILNNTLNMAQIMLGVTNTAPEPLLGQLANLLLNQHMPQDDSRTCKAIKEKITYLEQLTTLLDKFILYTLPSDAGAIVLNKKGYNYELS